MSRAAERERAAPVEPDRLEGFSAPREVEPVFGHEAAIKEFDDALRSGRMHHAWLLVGPEGIGKATLAYRFARTMLAEDALHGDAGGVFRKVAALSHPNLLLLRRAYNEKTKRYGQWIGVDEVRRLRAFLGTTAGQRGWRVVIVDRADELNTNAANALLKALEEPPARTLFLLISGAEGRLPVTIRSRTRTLRVASLCEQDLERAVRAAIERDDYKPEPEVLKTALALSEGGVRRALELISGEGVELYEEVMGTFAGLPDLEGSRLHAALEGLASAGDVERLELYMSLLLGIIERLIRYGATGAGATERERSVASRLVSPANLAAWAEAWEAISLEKSEAFALNLDKSLLVLDIWFRLQRLSREHPV
jgi:DNA polymerase III subunit delta'